MFEALKVFLVHLQIRLLYTKYYKLIYSTKFCKGINKEYNYGKGYSKNIWAKVIKARL